MCLALGAAAAASPPPPALQTHPSHLLSHQPSLLLRPQKFTGIHSRTVLSALAFPSPTMISRHFSDAAVTAVTAAASGKVLTGSGAPRDWGRLPAPAAPIPSIPLLVQTLLLLCVRHHCMVCAWTKQAAQRTTPLEPLSRENLPLLLLTTLRQPQQLMYTFAAVHS